MVRTRRITAQKVSGLKFIGAAILTILLIAACDTYSFVDVLGAPIYGYTGDDGSGGSGGSGG